MIGYKNFKESEKEEHLKGNINNYENLFKKTKKIDPDEFHN